MTKKLNKYLIIGLILFRITLELSYILIVQPMYGYYGFLNDVNWLKYILSWFVYIILSFLMKKIISNPLKVSNVIVLILFTASYIPNSSLYVFNELPNLYYFYFNVYWSMLLILEIFLNSRFTNIKIRRSLYKNQNIKSIALEIITLVFCLYVFYNSLTYNGLYINLQLSNIYELRSSSSNYDFGAMSGYLLTWSVIVLALAAVRYFEQKKWKLFLIVCYLELLLFSINGSKTTLLIIPISLIAYRYFSDNKVSLIPLGLSMINIFSTVVFFIINDVTLIMLTSFRSYYLPALISNKFYDFFCNNPPDFLKQSILRRFGLISKYEIPIPYLIDSIYFMGDSSANTGLFADAFSNFGPLGTIIYPFLLIGILYLLNYATNGLELKSNVAIILVLSVAFINNSFFTVLLTNGFLLLILLLLLYRRKRIENTIN